MDRVLRQMGVAGRRLDIAVAQQLADHRQGLAKHQRPGSEAALEIFAQDGEAVQPCGGSFTTGGAGPRVPLQSGVNAESRLTADIDFGL